MRSLRVEITGCFLLTASILLGAIPGFTFAQYPMYPVRPSLVPSGILRGKKIFLSPPTETTLTFQDFQGDLKNWGYYNFVQTQADADLLWEYHEDPVSITITDPASKVVLWTVNIPVYGYTSNKKKGAAQDAAGLILELKQLVGAPGN